MIYAADTIHMTRRLRRRAKGKAEPRKRLSQQLEIATSPSYIN
jgi:hypothetical protein